MSSLKPSPFLRTTERSGIIVEYVNGTAGRTQGFAPTSRIFHAMTVGTDPCVCPVTNDEWHSFGGSTFPRAGRFAH